MSGSSVRCARSSTSRAWRLLPDMSPALARYGFGGVRMSCVDMRSALDTFFDHAAHGRGGYIACTSTPGLLESQRARRLRQITIGPAPPPPHAAPTAWVG